MAQTPLLDADFFKYGNTMPYVFEKDASGTRVSPSLAYIKNAGGLFVPVSATDPMPTSITGRNLTTDFVSTRMTLDGSNWMGAVTLGDGQASGFQRMPVTANMYGYTGGTSDLVRVANVFKTVEMGGLATTAALTVWTPAALKKIRLMGAIILTGSSGQMKLRMGTAGAGATVVAVGGATGDTYYVNFGQGKLATTANDVLEVFNNNAGATSVWVTAWGTEE